MISDDDLLLYHYRDGLDATERARIGAALAEQPELAKRLHVLVAKLDAAAAFPEVPVPAETQQRWQAALALAATNQTVRAPHEIRRPFIATRWLAAAAVAAAMAIVAIVSVFQFSRRPPPQTAEVIAPDDAAGDASAYERGLKWHLAGTERQIVGLGSATPEERARLIETIVAQNRMYALSAERAGEPQLARVLRAFAPVLESLAHEGGESSASSIAQLSFELRVIQGRLGAGPDAPRTQSTTL